jgi:signal transduction histidine kinase/sugar lactone lactonase YvrE
VYIPDGGAAGRYAFESFGSLQGLKSQFINVLCQDREGFLWVGTQNGLYRYDGYRFLEFTTKDGLPSDSITSLHAGSDGTLWVGTVKGLAWRLGVRFMVPADSSLQRTTFIEGIASDDAGHTYVGTTQGLARATLSSDAGALRLELLPGPAGMKNPRITSIWPDPKGGIWFGCGTSICRAAGGDVQVWGESAGVPADGWQFLAKDTAGNLWARSRNYLLERPAGADRFRIVGQGEVAPLHFGLPSLLVDGGSRLFVPTDGGLSILRNGGWTRLGPREGLPSSIVTAVLRDRQGSLWVGMTSGLARWAGGESWENFTEMEGLSRGPSRSLAEDAAGGIWAGTGAGLSHGTLSGSSWKWSAVNDASLTWVANAVVAKDGGLWLSDIGPQVARLDPRTGKVRRYGQFPREVYSLMLDRGGHLWVLTTYALFRGDSAHPENGFERVIPNGSKANTVFTQAVEDRNGDLWVATFSGVFRFSRGKWSHIDNQSGLADNSAFSLAADADAGGVYVTYWNDPGIDYVRPEGDGMRASRVDRSKGLLADHVYSVHLDREGRLWALTDHGARLRVGDTWILLDQSDGLLWNDCNTFLSASDGSIWIGSDRGLTHFPSPHPHAPDRDPAVTFSEIWVGDRLAGRPPLVESRPQPFAARFTTLDLAFGSRVQYRYRAIGSDPQWRETSRPEVTFDYLRPGRYRLEVQARLPESPWRGEPAALIWEVRPRWFETGWFAALLAACLVSMLWGAWKLRGRRFAAAAARLQAEVDGRTGELSAANQQLLATIAERDLRDREKRQLEQELEQARRLESVGRLAGGVAHYFNNLLTVIIGHCDLLLRRAPAPQREPLQEIRKAGEVAAELTHRLLAFSSKQMLQPAPFSLAETTRDLEGRLRELAGDRIEVLVDVQPGGGVVMADRAQIERAIVELVTNALEAIDGPGRIAVTVSTVEVAPLRPTPAADLAPGQYEVITVVDTGRGMDVETLQRVFEPFFTTKEVGTGTGLGLAMVYGVIKQSGGSVAAESLPGKGSTFRIYLPKASTK